MRLHDAAGDVQPQPGPLVVVFPVLLEHVRQILGGDSAACVRHGEGDGVGLLPGAQRDPPAGWCELEGVADQVAEHLHDAVAIGLHESPRREVRRLERDLAIPRGGGVEVDRLVDDRADGLRPRRDRQLTVADAGGVDQLADQAVHAPDRAIDPLQPRPEGRVRARDAFAQRLDRRQRAAQIVSHDLQHTLARAGRDVGAGARDLERAHQDADDDAEPQEHELVHRRHVQQPRCLRPQQLQRQRAHQRGDDAGAKAPQPRRERDGRQQEQVAVRLHAPPGVERQAPRHHHQRERDGHQVSLPGGTHQQVAAYLHGRVIESDPSPANCQRPCIRGPAVCYRNM